MYYVRKCLEVAVAHSLDLDYESPCTRLHGHNLRITVCCAADTLDVGGMVVDFARIKRLVHDALDHRCLNERFDFNPTAENLACWICGQVPHCYKVLVEETSGNTAAYVLPGHEHDPL